MSLPHHLRRPDIEGLRALAVALVVSEHVFGAPRGGFIGVDVFFVISGFLIVGLLLREHERTGQINLVAFAERRVRRLAPAAVVVMGATLVVAALVFPAGRFTGVAEDAGWATVTLANWHFAAQQTDYFAADAPQSPLQHLWSLSVEEQFYVVVPLVLAGLLAIGGRAQQRRLATGLFLTIAVTSFGWAWFHAANDPSGAYFSTASRAWELAVGGVLASSLRDTARAEGTGPRLLFLRPTALAAIGWSGLAGIAAAAALLGGDVGFPAPYGALAVIGTVLVIVAGGRDGHTAPVVLRVRPAMWLGALSYSLYLWHFPVLVVIRTVSPEDVWLTIPVSLVFAIVTYQLVERTSATIPIRYGHTPRRSEWRAWGERVHRVWRRTGVLALASCVGVLFLFLADDRTPTPDDAAIAALNPAAQAPSEPHESGGPDATPDPADPSARSAARTEAIRRALTSTNWPATRPTIDEVSAPKYLESLAKDSEWSETLRCASSWSAASLDRCTFGDGDRTMMLVGDSTAGFLAPAFRAVVEQPDSKWRMVNAARFGCPWLDMAVAFDGSVDACEQHKTTTTQLIKEVRPDVVVVVNVASPTVDHPDEDRPITHSEWARAVSAMVEQVPSTRLLAVVPNPVGPDVRSCGAQEDPSGCVTSDSASRARAAALRTSLGDTAVVDTSPVWCARGRCPAFVGSDLVRVDTLHVHPAAGITARDELRALMRAADVDL